MNKKVLLGIVFGSLSFGLLVSGGSLELDYYNKVVGSVSGRDDLNEVNKLVDDLQGFSIDEFDIYRSCLPCSLATGCAVKLVNRAMLGRGYCSLRESIVLLGRQINGYNEEGLYDEQMEGIQKILAALDKYQPEEVADKGYM